MRNIIVRNDNLPLAKRKGDESVEFINSAKTKLNTFKSIATDKSSGWVSSYYSIHIGKPYCYVDRNASKYWYTQKKSDGTTERVFRQATYNYDAAEAAKAWVRSQRTAYLNAMTNLQGYLPTVLQDARTVRDSLKKLMDATQEFEETTYDLEEMYSKINDDIVGEEFVWDTTSYVDTTTGETIEYQVLYKVLEDGTRVTLNEAVNCSVTTLGATSDNIIALASSLSSNLTKEEIDKILKDMLDKTGVVMEDYLKNGFFGVTTSTGIIGLYQDVTGLEYDELTVKSDYNSLVTAYLKDSEEQQDYLASLVNAGAVGAMGVAAIIGNTIKEQGEMTEEQKKESNLEKYTKKDEETKEVYESYETKEPVYLNASKGTISAPKVEPVLEKTTYSIGPEGTKSKTITTTTDGDTQKKVIIDSNGLQQVTDNDLPNKIQEDTVTSEDIDLQASEEYYKQYSAEEIMNNRSQLYDKYNSMTDTEKVSALQELGYRNDVIADIVSNGTAGVTAYVIGHQNLEMASIAKEIASKQGLMEYTTSYETSANSDYFTSGEVLSDLVPTSTQVQTARTNLNESKVTYDEAITRANTAIDDANDKKTEYDRILGKIQKRSGTDPANWSKEDIENYNQATDNYNKAVEAANQAAKEVDLEKAKYEAQKQAYTAAKQEFATEIEAEINDTTDDTPNVDLEGVVVDNTPVSQTMVGVGDDGELISETRKISSSPAEVITLDTKDLQQMQQCATIVLEQESKKM